MAENVSWLKKSDTLLTRRPLFKINVSEVNSTMTPDRTLTNNGPKWTRRKSCVMHQNPAAAMQPLFDAMKPKKNVPKAEFKNRTLKMIQGRTSLAPKPANSRHSRIVPPTTRIPSEPQIKRLPLHMSTPCDPPRSILKAYSPKLKLSAAKKVNFDNLPDEGLFPLQESAIHDITKKVTKEIGTNTEPEVVKEDDSSLKSLLIAIGNQITSNLTTLGNRITTLEKKIDLLAEDSQFRKTSSLLETQVKSVKMFMSNLDDITEDRESVTPCSQETPSTQESTNLETPQTEDVCKEATPLVTRTSPDEHKKQTVLDEEIIKSPDVPLEKSPTPEGVQRRSTRSQVSDSKTETNVKSETSKLRNVRKRGIPQYLNSFELSPRPKMRLRRE